ncbi:MAG: ABC transporter ATP-binding protein, partial [Bacteroidaceae bacterium]|nr:ABC transporter ATP-binding protein [Bacteroidaceae bacterium]
MLKRIYNLLQADERKKALKMAITVFFTALLDFISLAALLPVLYFLLEDGNQNKAAFIFSIVAVVVIIVKSLFSILLTRYQNRCLLSFYKRLSFSLFSSYYNRGLLFIREQGSNKLGYEINSMCYGFSHSLLAPLCRMAGDALLILLITIALLIWNGATVLILYATFIPFMCFYFFGIKNKVRKYGEEDRDAKREQSRVVADTFRGYVDLEINGAFPNLQKSFLEGMDKIGNNRLKLDTLLRLPMFLSELSVVVGLVVLVTFGTGDIKMLIGVFAVAAFRLLPALRTILSCWTQIQNSECCLDAIEEGLKEFDTTETVNRREISFCSNINIKNLTYAYPNSEILFSNFNCNINKGEYLGFCGTSGAGKSTLFNLIIGLLEPTSGQIEIDGIALNKETRNSWIKNIGYVPQEVYIFNGTIAENIALGFKDIDKEKISQLIKWTSLDTWIDSLPHGIDTSLHEAGGNLSGGQKQRIGIARALYKGASVLLMDEATSALDNNTEQEI